MHGWSWADYVGPWRLYVNLVADAAWWGAAIAGIALLLLSPSVIRSYRRLPAVIRRLLGVLLLVTALLWAWSLRSMFDDAYISLRYARNLALGRGLVFNVGERVEGYTNFLWTLLLAGAIRLGSDGPRAAFLGCLAAFCAELLLVVRLARRAAGPASLPFIPAAALFLGASYSFATYATTGMETMLATLLMTWSLDRALGDRPGAAGLLGILAVMTHPDFALFYAGLGASLLTDRERRPGIIRYSMAFVLLYVPYYAWRWHYYGDPFPNTWYAKSAGLSYFSQGLVYLFICTLASGLWALLALAAQAMSRRPRFLLTRFVLLGVLPYLVYVGKIGGDFIVCRLVVPVLPVLAILAELALRDAAEWGGLRERLAAALLIAFAALPIRLIAPLYGRWDIADERLAGPVKTVWPRFNAVLHFHSWAESLAAVADRGVRPLVALGAIGYMGYVSDLPIVDMYGLTDRTIAHEPLQRRGRPGHERRASSEYLRARGVELSVVTLAPKDLAPWATVRILGIDWSLGRYDPALVAAIRSVPSSSVPDVPALIDAWKGPPVPDPARLKADVTFLEEFYFADNRDPERKRRVDELVASLAGTEGRTRSQAPPRDGIAAGDPHWHSPRTDAPMASAKPAGEQGSRLQP